MNNINAAIPVEDACKQKRMPIRRRLVFSMLAISFISIVVSVCAATYGMMHIRKHTEKELTEQLEDNLLLLVEQKANSADGKLSRYEAIVLFFVDYIKEMYEGGDALVELGTYIDSPRATTPEGEYAMHAAYASEDISEEDVMRENLFFSNIEKVWEPIARGNEGMIDTIYAGTKTGFLASYDKYSYLSAVPEGERVICDYFDSDWYRKGIESDGVFFTDVYTDSQGRGSTITVGAPFRDADNNVQGVCCLDFDITSLYDDLFSLDLGDGAYTFVIDRNKNIITADGRIASITEFSDLSEAQIEEVTSGENGFLEKDDGFYVYAPIRRAGLTFCAFVPGDLVLEKVSYIDHEIEVSTIGFIALGATIFLIHVIVMNALGRSITHPMELLEKDMEIISDGNLDHKADVYRNDEVGDMSRRLNAMVENLKLTRIELSDSQQHAEAMAELANKDALTGLKNKNAYDKEIRRLDAELAVGMTEFGIAMIDLNYLKKINDVYGHEKGDIAIRKLSVIVCATFIHSPVFRVGGDEFVVILRGSDYNSIIKLVAVFKSTIDDLLVDDELEPWERVSAAIGYATYDKQIDKNIGDVFRRADEEMYECKRAMKAARE